MAEETQDPQGVNDEQIEAAPQGDAEPQADQPAPDEDADSQLAQTEGDAPAEAEAEQPAQPEYDVQVEDLGKLKKKVTITVPASAITAKREEMFGELSHSAQVPGFRIGRAPRRLIEKRFGREIGDDVRNALIGQSLGKAMERGDLKALGEPELKLEDIALPETGDLVYDFEVEVAPEFALPELKGIEIKKPILAVSDERIDAALDRMRQREARYDTADEPAAKHDVVVVRAKVSGEGIDELETTVTLRVAPGQVEGLPLVDLGDQLDGKKAGDVVTVTVKVPEVHPTEAWRGKEATVQLTVNEVRKRSLPEIDDEFAARMSYQSLAELREYIAGRMTEQVEQEAQRAMRDQVHQYLLGKTSFELPEGVAKRHMARMLQRRLLDLLQAGMTQEQVQENMAMIESAIAQEADRDLKLAFILQRVAEEKGIAVSDEELNARVAQMAMYQDRRPERYRQELEAEGNLQQVAVSLQEEMAANVLLADATIVEVTPEQLAAEAEEKAKAAQAEAKQDAPDEAAPAGQDAPATDTQEPKE